jgi:hypothetical protein
MHLLYIKNYFLYYKLPSNICNEIDIRVAGEEEYLIPSRFIIRPVELDLQELRAICGD